MKKINKIVFIKKLKSGIGKGEFKMGKILIIGEYPNKDNIKDGMIRRIDQIDKKINEKKRVYLNIKFFSNIRMTIEEKLKVKIYNINFFLHFIYIKKEINRNKKIYIHSLLNYTKVFLFLKKNKEVIVDMHGAVVEEMEFYNKKMKFYILWYLEKTMFHRLNKVIFVNKRMSKFFSEKYPILKNKKIIIYPILDLEKNIKEGKVELISEDKVNFIYSGNLQKWQNIDLMLENLKKVENENYNYIFLTGQLEELEKKIKSYKIKNYILKSVLPEELKNYYEKCDYGFLLRDNHILNEVANPTKLSEYMEYGIVPIVKFENIGDYLELGYEYLKIEKISTNLKKYKSLKNKKILEEMKKKIEKIDFIKFIWE